MNPYSEYPISLYIGGSVSYTEEGGSANIPWIENSSRGGSFVDIPYWYAKRLCKHLIVLYTGVLQIVQDSGHKKELWKQSMILYTW